MESEDFIFTAERIPTNRWDTPANVHVITSEEIEKNHYQDLYEALSHVNGVAAYMARETYGGAALNGGHRVLLLLNGHRIHSTQSGLDTHKMSTWGMIPSMKIIDRIEIVKGGGSALYGTDAVDGIINIITKKGTFNETTIDFNTGSWRRHNYELTNQGTAGKFSWFVSGALNKSHAWTSKANENIVNRTDDDLRDYSNNGAYIRLDNRFDDSSSLTLDFLHHSRKNSDTVAQRYSGIMTDGTGTYYEFFSEIDKNRTDLYNDIAISYNFKEGTNTPGWLRYYNNYQATSKTSRKGSSERIQGLEYQNGWELGRHKIIAGFEYHRNNFDSPDTGINDLKLKNTAAYFQDTIRLGNKWTLIPGLRYDHSNDYGHKWSPKIAANYRPDDKTKMYISWGRSFRAPNLAENFTFYRAYPYMLLGNSYTTNSNLLLRPETGYTATIGIEHKFDDNTNIALNFFKSELKDTIRWASGNVPDYANNRVYRARAALNMGENERYKGVELTFNQKIGEHFFYHLGYSNIRTEYAQYSNQQPIGGRIGIGYNNRGLNISLLSLLVSGRPATSTVSARTNYDLYYNNGKTTVNQSKKYAVFDLNINYDINEHFTTYFKMLNFTNQDYNSLDYDHYPKRSFVGGLEIKF